MITSDIKTRDLTAMGLGEKWNINPVEYVMTKDGTSKTVDFQDLMVTIAEQSALVVEQEILPQSERIRKRNAKLVSYGRALSDLAAFSARFDTSKPNDSKESYVSLDLMKAVKELMNKDWWGNGGTEKDPKPGNQTRTKSEVDQATQIIKTQVDKLNNESQASMTRLQGLVGNRDKRFELATSQMTHISDVRGNLIKGLA